jgi:predicted ArsR family transcriptional regulator
MSTTNAKWTRGRKAAEILRQTRLSILLYLESKGDWVVPKMLAEELGIGTNRLRQTLVRLRREGLIELEDTGKRAGKTTRRLRLTAKGTAVARHLLPAVLLLEDS